MKGRGSTGPGVGNTGRKHETKQLDKTPLTLHFNAVERFQHADVHVQSPGAQLISTSSPLAEVPDYLCSWLEIVSFARRLHQEAFCRRASSNTSS